MSREVTHEGTGRLYREYSGNDERDNDDNDQAPLHRMHYDVI